MYALGFEYFTVFNNITQSSLLCFIVFLSTYQLNFFMFVCHPRLHFLNGCTRIGIDLSL